MKWIEATMMGLLLCLSVQAREYTQTWATDQSVVRWGDPIRWFQGESVTLTILPTLAGETITISSNAELLWEVATQGTNPVVYLAITGALNDAGAAVFSLAPSNSILPAGSYQGFVRAMATNESGLLSDVYVHHRVTVQYSPASSDYEPVGPISIYSERDPAFTTWLDNFSSDWKITTNFLFGQIQSLGEQNLATSNALALSAATLGSNITEEAQARISADASTSNALALSAATLGSNITTEAQARIAADSAITGRLDTVETTALTSVSCSGGWYHPDWFTLELKPYPYHVISAGATQAQNSVYVNTITVDSAAGYLLSPDILRASSFTGGVVAYTALSNCSIERVSITNYGWDGYSTQQWDAVIFDPDLTTGTVAGITCTLNGFQRSTQIVYVTSNLYSYYQYQGDVPGSLRALINTSLAARAANTNKSIKLFADGWPTTWTRNTNCWAYNIDLTCASPWNSQGNQAEKGGTAITRQHVLYAAHYSFTNGARLLFVDATNGLYWRAIVDQRTLALPNCDARIGLLDQPLPESIHPAFLLQPSDNGRFAGVANMSGGLGIRTVHLKAVEANEPKVFAKWACYAISPEADAAYGLVGDSVAAIGRYDPSSPFGAPAIVGDSGQPTFIIVDYFVILYSAFHGAMGGPNYGYLCAYMESAIADMGSTIYTNLHYVNLEAWRDLYLPALP